MHLPRLAGTAEGELEAQPVVHPAEFLVTGPDGSIVRRTILGDRLLISPDDVGGEKDLNRVFLFDLPLR